MEGPFLLEAYKAVFNFGRTPSVLLKPNYPFFNVMDVNESFLRLTQSTKEEMLNKPFVDSYKNESDCEDGSHVSDLVKDALNLTVTSGKGVNLDDVVVEVKIPGSNKFESKSLKTTNTPVINKSGEIMFVLHSVVEVTEAKVFDKRTRTAITPAQLQEEFYRSVFLQAPVAIGIWEGPSFITSHVNPQLAQFYEKDISDLIGKPIFEIFPKAKRTWVPIMKKVFTSGEPFRGKELEVNLSEDGELKCSYVNFVLVPHYELSGRISGVIGVSIDVTEQVVLRKTVENNELMMKLAAESAKLGIWDINLKSSEIFSSSHLWMAGFPLKGNFTIEDFVEFIVPEDRARVLSAIKRADDHFAFPTRVKWADATVHWLQLTGKILRNKKNEPVRIVGTTLDITDTKELEKRKDELISTVSHELKTPVTSIKAIAQILEKKFNFSEDRNTSELLNRLVNQIKRLTNLIHDLLDASLIEGGKLQLKNSHFNFNELVAEVAMEAEKTFTTHKIVLENNPEIPCFNDKERLRQVLINLLSNAIKYSPGKDKVIVNIGTKNNSIYCSVTDFGVGIPKEKESHIFDRFYRIVDERHFGFQGIGIGLYISKQIIERLDGKIWFESKPEQGTTFHFYIPCKAVDAD